MRRFANLLFFLCWMVAFLPAKSQDVGPADLIVVGKIYTVNGPRSWADALAVKGSKIIFVGAADAARKLQGPQTKLVELRPDEMVLPGLVDAHVHLLDGGLEQLTCQLAETKTPEELLKTVADYAKAHRDQLWVLGSGWPMPFYPDGNPNKAILDAVILDRPVWLVSQDGHSGWANSAALKLAGINKDTPEPPFGRIERDAAGEPTGTLREAAMNLIFNIAPQPPQEQWIESLRKVQKLANSLGITQIQEANAVPRLLETYYTLAKKDELTVKVVAAQATDPGQPPSQVDAMIERRKKFTMGNLTASSAKIFADGCIESHTAALLEPYADKRDDCGLPNWTPEKFAAIAQRLDKEGFQIHVHVIGDQATRAALDALEAAQKANGRNDNRHHLAHLQMIAPEDLSRFRELGITANFQPFWFFADKWIVESTDPLLGPQRAKRQYQIQSILKTGAVVCAGSDWTVSSLNPFEAIQVGMTRQPIKDPLATAPWLPEERASLTDLLAAYTINGAYVNHLEKSTGSIEVGKAADFIVIDRNLFAISPYDIGGTKVLRTYVDGKEVYRADP